MHIWILVYFYNKSPFCVQILILSNSISSNRVSSFKNKYHILQIPMITLYSNKYSSVTSDIFIIKDQIEKRMWYLRFIIINHYEHIFHHHVSHDKIYIFFITSTIFTLLGCRLWLIVAKNWINSSKCFIYILYLCLTMWKMHIYPF